MEDERKVKKALSLMVDRIGMLLRGAARDEHKDLEEADTEEGIKKLSSLLGERDMFRTTIMVYNAIARQY